MTDRTARIIGTFSEHSPPPVSGLELTVSALDFVVHWRRCSITADWLGTFGAYDFEHRDVALAILSTVINELLENAAKFASDKGAPIRLALRHYGDVIRIQTQNRAQECHVRSLEALLALLDSGDPEVLFARQIEEAAPDTSGIGLIILRKDYATRIAARFVPLEQEQGDGDTHYQVDIQVTLAADDIDRIGKESAPS